MASGGYTFRQFILDQMQRREMSGRQFALYIGVDPSTITRAIDARRTDPKPGLDFLIKLAEKTNTDIADLFALAYPEVTKHTALSPNARIMAQRFEELPKNVQEAVWALIRGYVT